MHAILGFCRRIGIMSFLLVLQFDALHEHGSSHGKTRITRRAYWQPYYIKMMDEAHHMWSDLERENDTTLYKYVSLLEIIAVSSTAFLHPSSF